MNCSISFQKKTRKSISLSICLHFQRLKSNLFCFHKIPLKWMSNNVNLIVVAHSCVICHSFFQIKIKSVDSVSHLFRFISWKANKTIKNLKNKEFAVIHWKRVALKVHISQLQSKANRLWFATYDAFNVLYIFAVNTIRVGQKFRVIEMRVKTIRKQQIKHTDGQCYW